MRLILCLLLFVPAGVWAQQSYTIKGETKNFLINGRHVYLIDQNGGGARVDSALVTDGKYSFSGAAVHPGPLVLIDVPISSPEARTRKHVATLYLEPGTVSIVHVDSFSNATVSGGPYNAAYAKMIALFAPVIDKSQSLSAELGQASKQGDTARARILQKALIELDHTGVTTLQGYARDNPNSPLALFALESSIRGDLDPDTVGPIFSRLPETVRASEEGQVFKKKLDAAGVTNIGSLAPDFIQNDTLGKPVSLSSFRGKYVLVDFWASWCGPCRMENPNVVMAFNKYKVKGFAILSVSLDKPGDRDKWLAAIHKDGLRWTHVSDLKFWDNAAARAYGVDAIPQNFLLDPNGKILAKGLRGEELEKTLEGIYK